MDSNLQAPPNPNLQAPPNPNLIRSSGIPQLVGNRLCVREIKPERETPGGVILPDTHRQDQTTAVVVSIGKGVYDHNGNRVPLDVEVNDVVVIANDNTSTPVLFERVQYRVLFDYQIICIVGKVDPNE